MLNAARIAGGTAFLVLCASSPFAWGQSDDVSKNFEQRLRELLRNQGYSQIEFLELSGNTLTAKACTDGTAYRVTFNRNARVIERAEAGECDSSAKQQPVSEDVIIDSLYGKGYLRINIVDRTPPTLLVNACQGDRKFQIRMDNEGDVIDRKEEGECNLAEGDPLEPAQIERILSLQGYRKLRMPVGDEPPYAVTACNGTREFELTVTKAAQINARKAISFCDTKEPQVEYVPPLPIEESRLSGTDALSPESCQMVLDWLQYETPVIFSKESAALSDEDLTRINRVVATIKRCPTTRVLVEGHTSQTGDDAFNQDLSEKRALAVQQALLDAGIKDNRLDARGFGESYPRVPGDVDARLNRRIEIQLEWDSPKT